MNLETFKKIVIVPVLLFTLTGPIFAPFAKGFSFPDRYDLVVILVEQGLYGDINDYNGLANTVSFSTPISSTTLKSRVDRYALDIQNSQPGSRALIIQADRFESTQNIASVLEKIYFEGDPKEPTRAANLKGIVMIGEVPLPVVNKNGTRFISVYPYTDFEQKAYLWNKKTGDFEYSNENSNPQPELWHGVIRPPVTTRGEEGKELLASYFDKNHLFHIGDSSYATFDKKIFFQDLFNEKKNLNADAYKSYENFLLHMDDVAYMRYTRELYKELSGGVENSLAQLNKESRSAQAKLSAYGIPFRAPPASQSTSSSSSAAAKKNEIPDIVTKISKMSDNLMFRFFQNFTKYPNLVNDFVKYTGRYITQDGETYRIDADSPVNLITAKDQYTLTYLKAINDMVEAKVDSVIAQLQKNVPLTNAVIEVESLRRNVEGETKTISPLTPGTLGTPAEFVNYSPARIEYKLPNFTTLPSDTSYGDSLNGKPLNEVNSVEQCTSYRGSVPTSADSLSKLVEINRSFNEMSASDFDLDRAAMTGRTMAEKNENYFCHSEGRAEACDAYKHFAGCFYDTVGNFYEQKPPKINAPICFPEHATDPVLMPSGTREVKTNPPENYDNFKSCFKFYEKNQYIEYLRYLGGLLAALSADEQGTRNSKLRAIANYLSFYARIPIIKSTKEKKPDDIIVFASTDPPIFKLTLSDVLKGLGWDPSADGDAWRAILTDLLVNSASGSTRTVQIGKNNIIDAQIKITRPNEKTISSVMYHKEPTKETLKAQAENLITKSLPVDYPRYVTFQDQVGEVGKVVYPDIFAAASIDEYLISLADIEAKLNSFLKAPNAAVTCEGCLKNLFVQAEEAAEYPASGEMVISRANSAKVVDALGWNGMDADSKHAYLNRNYIDTAKDAYIGKAKNGYEMLYMNGEGRADRYEFAFNLNAPTEDDADFADAVAETEKFANGEFADEEADTSGSETGGGDETQTTLDNLINSGQQLLGGGSGQSSGRRYDLFSWTPPPVSPWWERMQEWLRDLKTTTRKVPFGDSAVDFYNELNEENQKMLDEIAGQRSAYISKFSSAGETSSSKIDSIKLVPTSSTIGKGKSTAVELSLLDKDGQIVKDEFAQVTIKLDGKGKFGKNVSDDNSQEDGVQATVLAGIYSFEIEGSDAEEGDITLNAQLNGEEKKAETKIAVIDHSVLALRSSVLSAPADGQSKIKIDVSVLDKNNSLVSSANGIVKLSVSDDMVGVLEKNVVGITAGKGSVDFIAGKKAGDAVITATSSSFDPGRMTLSLLPGAPKHLGLIADDEIMPVAADTVVKIEARLYDEFGNFVNTAVAGRINFRITEATNDFGMLSSQSEPVSNGIAVVSLRPRQKTGTVNIIAELQGLPKAAISIKATQYFDANIIKTLSINALTASLLGIPAGDVNAPDFLAGRAIMSGKLQTAVSLTTDVKQYQKLLNVGANGGLSFPSGQRVTTSTLPGENLKILARDTQKNIDLSRILIIPLAGGQVEQTAEVDYGKLSDGLFMRKTSASDIYEIAKKADKLSLLKSGGEAVSVRPNGNVQILNNDFSLRVREGEFLILEILDKQTVVAEIAFVSHFNQDVKLDTGSVPATAPGVYIKPFKSIPEILWSYSLYGNSSTNPRGMVFYDKSQEDKSASKGGFSSLSLDDSLNTFGVGFTEDNKFALLFAAGETFGEANRPYASDIGIVLGDPTVKINTEDPSQRSPGQNFTKDVGKELYSGNADIRNIINFDYNSDGNEDLLLLEGKNKVRLLQNKGGGQFKDQGYLFEVNSGIQDLAKIDFNNDGQMDLAVAGSETCRKGDTCLDIFENRSGAFTRRNIKIAQKEMILTIRSSDLNLDGFSELIFADTAGDIKVLYNFNGEFNLQPQIIGNIGLKIDPAKNLIQSVLVRYPNMTTKIEGDILSGQKYETLTLPGNSSESGDKDFIFADLDEAALAGSTKTALDLNGGGVKTGDIIRYIITLKNNSGAPIKDLMVSDAVSQQLELDASSIKCTDCASGQMKIAKLNDESVRPFLLGNITIPAHASRQIVYEAAYTGKTDASAKINIGISSGFTDEKPEIATVLKQDEYPDISVTKADNPTGRVKYYFSAGLTQDKKIMWGETLSSPPAPSTPQSFDEQTGLHTPTMEEIDAVPYKCVIPGSLNPVKKPTKEACLAAGGVPGDIAGPPPIAEEGLNKLQGGDKDNDGLPDSIDDVTSGAGDLANGTQDIISKLTCSPGCIALPPVNMSFLTPGKFSILGMPAGDDKGLPVFGWGYPDKITTWPPQQFSGTNGGRIYVSPTITGGLGFAVCLGRYGGVKNCYSFATNPLTVLTPGLCDKVNATSGDALSQANSVVSTVNEGMMINIGGGVSVGAESGRNSGSGLDNYSLGNYETPTAAASNKRIPGFPSMITDWLTAQLEEFENKALSMPDLYVIYPTIDSMVGSVKPKKELSDKIFAGNVINNVISWLNSVPLLDIQTREVYFNVPMLTMKEISKFQADAFQWVADEKEELNKWRSMMGCFKPDNLANPELCQTVTVDINKLIDTVTNNMKALDEWVMFPKKLLQLRAMEAYYLGQIVDYLDTIIHYSGGWVTKNAARVKQWKRAILQAKQSVQSFKIFTDVILNYQQSCDQCKTERFGLMQLPMMLLAVIPMPPIIPLPKMPDIILDVSKIQAGIHILWPDIKFKPEPLTIPRLPRIALGVNTTVPLFKRSIPSEAFRVIPSPPKLPTLPQLPELKLPRLPDIPPPPTMPGFPPQLRPVMKLIDILFKIYCMVKNNLLPDDENNLKSKIELLTTRTLGPVQPLDLLFTVKSKAIRPKYVDQIKVTGSLNLQMNFDLIQRKVEDAAREANKYSTDFVKGANQYSDSLSKQLEQTVNPTIQLSPEGRPLNFNGESGVSDLISYIDEYISAVDELKVANENRKNEIAALPNEYVLKADEVVFDPNTDSQLLAETDENQLLPSLKRLKDYRDGIVAYIKDSNNIERNPEIAAEFDNFTAYIKEQKSPFIAEGLKKYLASANVDDEEAQTRMIALTETPDLSGALAGENAQDDSLFEANGRDVGIFTFDENGKSSRLINYTYEVEKTSQLTRFDMDGDGDADTVYSYGPNVFLKKNLKNRAENLQIFRPEDLEYWTVFELLPAGMSINYPRPTSQSAHEASFGFIGNQMNNIAGYEVITKNSPAFFDAPSREMETLKIHLLGDNGENSIINLNDETKATLDSLKIKPANITRAYASVKTISGQTVYTGVKRDFANSGSGKIKVSAGEVLHAIDNVKIIFNKDLPDEAAVSLPANLMVTVPDSYSDGLYFAVDGGNVEIIKSEPSTQPAASGMAILYGDRINVKTGIAQISYLRGGVHTIGLNEQYSLRKVENIENPTASIAIDPGFYFAKIYSFDSEGKMSTGSEKMMLSPQVCGDTGAPLANVGKDYFQVAVGKTLELDAGKSFDAQSKVISYRLDTDTTTDSNSSMYKDMDIHVDSDGDGNPSNDGDSPIFPLGPYDQVGLHHMRLTVRDEALNEGYQDITVEVITPKIILDETKLHSNIIGGHVIPPEENVPITIAILRSGTTTGGWEIFKTASADSQGQYYTNDKGEFEIKDADLRDRFVVKNNENKVIAEINSKTGRITISDDRYEVRSLPAQQNPSLPTRMAVFLKSDSTSQNPLTFVYMVPDVNVDVAIDGTDTRYKSGMFGVHIKPLPYANDAGIEFSILPADNATLPGAAKISKGGEALSTIDVNGDILLFDPKLSIRVKAATGDEPVIFEMVYDGNAIAEIFIATDISKQNWSVGIVENVMSVLKPKLVPRTAKNPFADIKNDDPFAQISAYLYSKGIIAGYPSDKNGEILFKPENQINRAEFTQITMKMLCIIPREEAKKLPSPFLDALDPTAWFYPVLKEGNIRGFIRGYLGETQVSADGIIRAPFKPAKNITWAESATVVLAALQEEGIIDISKVDLKPSIGAPWYEKYVLLAQDIKPYLKNPGEPRSFLLTKEESLLASQPISRRDFAIMAQRVLLIHDCTKSAMSNEGGTEGGETTVINKEFARNEEGIFVVRPDCGNMCPCRASVDTGADLKSLDAIFAAITGHGGLPIYAKSNEARY